MQSGQNDDELVARIDGLVDQCTVVGGLAGLDITHDQAPGIKVAVRRGRVLKVAQEGVGIGIQPVDDPYWEAPFDGEIVAVPFPELPIGRILSFRG